MRQGSTDSAILALLNADNAVKLLAAHFGDKWGVRRNPLDTEVICADTITHKRGGKRGRIAIKLE